MTDKREPRRKPGFAATPAIDRIFTEGRVYHDGGCWMWRMAVSEGYGIINEGGTSKLVHRVVYEALRGPIPEGMTLDHLCRERACCNPYHVEVVSDRENVMRGLSFGAVNARKKTCPKGHPLEPRNGKGWRLCRQCQNEQSRKSYHKRKAARAARS